MILIQFEIHVFIPKGTILKAHTEKNTQKWHKSTTSLGAVAVETEPSLDLHQREKERERESWKGALLFTM